MPDHNDGLIHGPQLDAALEVATTLTPDKLPLCQTAFYTRLDSLYGEETVAQCRAEIEEGVRREAPDLDDAAVARLVEASYDKGNFTLGLALGWELALRQIASSGPTRLTDV